MPSKSQSEAGRKRVLQALDRVGMLLIQGQAELPSIADLLAGAPITTRGYSWDYVPAWKLADELAERDDIARIKLFRGRLTLVHQRLWTAVEVLATRARARLLADRDSPRCALLELIESEPGVPGGEVRKRLQMSAAQFQREKTALEQRLCVFGQEREDTATHTHESRWFSWAMGKVAEGVADVELPSESRAIDALLATMQNEHTRPARPSALFPVLRA